MALSARQKDHKNTCKERVKLQKHLNALLLLEDTSDENILKAVADIRAISKRILRMKEAMGIPAKEGAA